VELAVAVTKKTSLRFHLVFTVPMGIIFRLGKLVLNLVAERQSQNVTENMGKCGK
jgi:hypothetical protein